uniref:Uncharacterized protein n=1 Tax=Caenorhabditis japonica TaxID=281687 RepID=A0A8R1IMU4_CAEJA
KQREGMPPNGEERQNNLPIDNVTSNPNDVQTTAAVIGMSVSESFSNQNANSNTNVDPNPNLNSTVLVPIEADEKPKTMDTFAPVKYNIGTIENCFMLIMVLRPDFGKQFSYSVRVSDRDMKEQLLQIEREKEMQSSWRNVPSREKKALSEERKPRTPTTPEDEPMREENDTASEAPGSSSDFVVKEKIRFILQIVNSATHI